ncbi:MAG: bifunctional riboflavin kinase/FAD synthetase [Clostridia bacterium]|nr:bifunctional riboflavin kinase/FAD synthetase [Clostridia bacterium]
MNVINLQTSRKEEGISSPLSVALGNFDGVHKGHTELIRRAVAFAREHGIKSAVWTFSDGAAVLPNKPDVPAVTTTEEKLSLIRSLGVDYAILEDFERVRKMSPEAFVSDILIKKCRAQAVVCGFNFRFGACGAGDADTLRRLISPRECIVVEPVYVGERLVSSSAIRRLIEAGDMECAAELLGHPFAINFPVAEGKHLGRTIGIPTINQNFPGGHIIPRSGVYVCKVYIAEGEYIGITNVGVRPTVEDGERRVNCETHIIGYDGWLYGQKVRVEFHKHLRDEERFESLDALRAQIQRDICSAKAYFK